MHLRGKYVLIEQSMIAKKTKIITDAANDDRDKFDFSFKIIQLGPECNTDLKEGEIPLKIGDIPLFRKHVQFEGVKIIEKTKEKMLSHVIVYDDDIIGIDDEELPAEQKV